MIDKLLILGASGDLAGRYLLPSLAHLHEAGRLPEPLAIVGVAADDWDTTAFRRHVAARLERHAATVDLGSRKALITMASYQRADAGDAAALAGALDQAKGPRRRLPGAASGGVRTRDPGAGRGRASPRQPGGGRKSPSAAAWPRRTPSASSWKAASVNRRPSAPTTTWACRPSRTSSGCGSPTASSSPSGMPGTSSGSRSSGTRRSRWKAARAATTTPAPCATWSKTTCCSWSAWPRWSRPSSTRASCTTARWSCCMRSSRPHPGWWPPAPSALATAPGGSTASTCPPTPTSPGVDPARGTETFTEVTLEIDNLRWSGVPFTLRTGKALAHRRAEILVHIRPASQPTFAEAADAPTNLLRFGLDPGRLTLRVNLTGAGDPFRLGQATLGRILAPQDLPAYGRLLQAVLDGDSTLSIRGDEAEESWRMTEPILAAWTESTVPLQEYPAGSAGPPTIGDHSGNRPR